MSAAAHSYYAQRAERMSCSVPGILDGRPVTILGAAEPRQPGVLAGYFASQMEGVESFVLDGVRYLHGEEVPQAEWERVRGLRRHGQVSDAKAYALRQLGRYLITDEPGSAVLLEALAEGEAPRSSYILATTNRSISRTPGHETARATLLARTITSGGSVSAAHITVVWGEHKTLPGNSRRQFLTPHYLGHPVLDREMGNLPPLHWH